MFKKLFKIDPASKIEKEYIKITGLFKKLNETKAKMPELDEQIFENQEEVLLNNYNTMAKLYEDLEKDKKVKFRNYIGNKTIVYKECVFITEDTYLVTDFKHTNSHVLRKESSMTKVLDKLKPKYKKIMAKKLENSIYKTIDDMETEYQAIGYLMPKKRYKTVTSNQSALTEDKITALISDINDAFSIWLIFNDLNEGTSDYGMKTNIHIDEKFFNKYRLNMFLDKYNSKYNDYIVVQEDYNTPYSVS